MSGSRLGNGYSGPTGVLQSCGGACRVSMSDRLAANNLGSEIGGEEATAVVFPDDSGTPTAGGCRVEYDRTVQPAIRDRDWILPAGLRPAS